MVFDYTYFLFIVILYNVLHNSVIFGINYPRFYL